MSTVTVVSGTSRITLSGVSSIIELKGHPLIEALMLGDNIDVKQNGVVLSDYAPITEGSTVSLSQRASDKGQN